MLKKIPVEELRLGMHLHAMCGAWLDHPFWRTKFILRDTADLEKLRASSVTEVWIDVVKGCDVEPAAAGVAPRRDAAARSSRSERPAPSEPAPPAAEPKPSASMAAEMQRASALVNQSREAVSSLFAEARMGRALDTEKCLPLVDEIASSVWRNPGAIVSLARLKTHDDYTYMHSMAVCALMVSLGRQLGMDENSAREIGLAGMLHDMGKAMMPLEVLNKPAKLTDAEYAIMQTHPQHGYELLLEGKGVSEVALDVTLHHHERPDGKGYPHGLSGDALTRVARMGGSVRRLRRDHLEPALQERLGPGRVDRQDGLLGRAVRQRHLPGLREEPGHLPDRLAGAYALGPARRGGGAERGIAAGAEGESVLLDQVEHADHRRAARPVVYGLQ